MKTENSYTGILVDPDTGSESVMPLSEPLNIRYRMSNLHLLDWKWYPEKGSAVYARNKAREKPKGHRWTLKIHVEGLGCYWATRKRCRIVSLEDFKRGKDWEQCIHCTILLQELRPKVKPQPKEVPLEVRQPDTYIKPVNWTPEERSALGMAKRDADKDGVRPDHYRTPQRTKTGENATLTRL